MGPLPSFAVRISTGVGSLRARRRFSSAQAVEFGQHQVQNHQVVDAVAGKVVAGLAVRGPVHRKAGAVAQGRSQVVRQPNLVFHKQHAHGEGLSDAIIVAARLNEAEAERNGAVSGLAALAHTRAKWRQRNLLRCGLECSTMRGYMSSAPASTALPSLDGSVLVLIQFAVCEQLRLDLLQQTISARTLQLPTMKHSVPAYVRYQRPPVIEPLEPLLLESGERLDGEIKYYDYGIVSVIFQLRFSGDWESLVHLASRWVWDVDFASRVEPIVRQKLERASAAMVKPYSSWLSEDYFIFHVREAAGAPSAADLAREHALQIAQVVRGDRLLLSEGECAEVLNSQISYYANDVAVIGWNAAFIYDSTAGAETAIQPAGVCQLPAAGISPLR